MNILKFLFSVIFLIYCFSSDLKAKNLEIEITKNLRCLICQGQSVYDSDSEFANSLKILVEKKLNEGLDEKQIYVYLKDKYGGLPTVSGLFPAILRFGPFSTTD